ncbi:class I SAM-dependent methyltransferase [Egicoccus sp. AB-alg2]|uniref:class I SAM-dependent methyltransferase n=1 Tax=Egicoccus sp. AB-alg2 TaxID=3242693 RepID=UPI00359E565E
MTTLLTLAPDHCAEAVRRLGSRLAARGHDLPLRLWNGEAFGGSAGAGYRLVLRHPWSLRALLRPPVDLHAGEAFLTGALDVEGSMVAALRDVARLRHRLTARDKLELAAVVLRLPPPPDGLAAGRKRLTGRPHSRERDVAAVRHHYDVGNDFYRLVLDDDLVYSCGYFAETDRDATIPDRAALGRAQRRKLELICRKLALRPDEHFLDVGCGWGSLVIHAARRHGVRALGITLSERQAELARQRVAAAGVSDRVRIVIRDYRDVVERFDAIASVGMVEHVGADLLPTYVKTLYRRLADDGRLLNHGITTGRRDVVRDFARSPDTFVGRYVFPDGALVPAHHMVRELERGGFEIQDLEQLRPHYALTLQHWLGGLEASYDRARELVGEATARVWRAYLAGSVLGFESGDLGVVQILATRSRARLPLDRRRMLLPMAGDAVSPDGEVVPAVPRPVSR